ncbi:MAG: radical SAM protein [Candidatus Acidiferrales bacterium]
MIDSSYGAFSKDLHDRQLGRRTPAQVSIEVTRRCPLKCIHCYNNLPMGDREARSQELTFEEHCKLLDELVEAGCLWLLYTGGEIFGRSDFLDIYTEAKKRGFLITLFTNGTMITPRIADYLAEWRPFSIEITLYGATRETYEALTRVPGSYDRCIRGIRLLLERHLPLKLKTVPTTVNQHEVYEMKRMAEEDFGVQFKFDPMLNPRIDCSQSPLAVRLSSEEAVALDFLDPRREKEYRELIGRILAAGPPSESAAKKVYGCGGGNNSCAIDPVGQMSICVLSHQEGYNIREGSFREGWEGPLQAIRQKPSKGPTICSRCQLRPICGMCAANGELENGDPEKPVEFLCQVAHLRMYTLGYEVPEHGDCGCCKPGKSHDALVDAAGRIREGLAGAERPEIPKRVEPFNILQAQSSCGSGSCGSCETAER